MKITRIIRNILFITIPSLVLCVLFLELFFRYIIPAAEQPSAYFDRNDQIMRFDVNKNREGIYTKGKRAQLRAKWNINNYGWNSQIDYTHYRERDKPLIAIIGDSFVEAFQVDVDKNIAAIMRTLVGKDYDVYSFGFSGAPLSQYLHVTRYVNRHFKPIIVVYNVVENDFSQSIKELANYTYFLQLSYKKGRGAEVPPQPYRPNFLRRILGKSALVRYLYINIELERTFKDRGSNGIVDHQKIEHATFLLVKKIKEENTDKHLIFMMDAPRRDIYSDKVNNGDSLWTHKILKEACFQNEAYFIDLTQPFLKKFKQDGTKFDSEVDYHWNEAGHATAAKVLYEALVELDLISK